MVASGDIRRKLYISYGAMGCVFTYLPWYEIVPMQAVSRFMSQRGVQRLQMRILLFRPTYHYFHYSNSDKFSRTLISKDPNGRWGGLR